MVTIDMDMPKNCIKCPFYNDSHYLNNCFIGSLGVPNRYGYDASTIPEWCPIQEKSPLKWERLKGVMTPGGDPCVRCPVCKSRDSEHLIGIERHQHWKYCPMCGERLEE